MPKLFIILTLSLLPTLALGADLKPFTTDGCSAFFDGTLEQKSLWAHCCIKHDIAYWKGGTSSERLAADQSLEQCVEKSGEPEIAQLMLAGVRAGGSPYFPTSYRWGYGWPYPRGYKALTDAEKSEVLSKLKFLQILINSIAKELNP